jgi:hypothetical protein
MRWNDLSKEEQIDYINKSRVSYEHTKRQVIPAKWKFMIDPSFDNPLTIKAEHNEITRAMYELSPEVKDVLAAHAHALIIDRGDWGDGVEHFHITFTKEAGAKALIALCQKYGIGDFT